MDDQTRDFVSLFARFLEEVVPGHRDGAGDGSLGALVREHVGEGAADLPVVTEDVPFARFPDLDAALNAIADEGGESRVVGISGGRHSRHLDLHDLVAGDLHAPAVGPVSYANMPVGPDEERRVVAWGVRLLTFDGRPLAVLQRRDDDDMEPEPAVTVLAPDEELAGAFLQRLRQAMLEHSVLRGQVVSFSGDPYGSSLGGLAFVRRPEVGVTDVVLPVGTLERLVRHVVGPGDHRERLLAAGQHLKRGILLYGPPGTGKTLTVRHLLARTPGTTAILLSGEALGGVRQATAIARAMQPGLVVLEDCDLIAQDRDLDGDDSMLFELLDALDGLGADADVTFLLTTNRPDLLERALVRRPGRVDLAVEIPLPDRTAREALFTLYARGLPFSREAVLAAAARAEGVTASFAKELVRRAVLAAAVQDRDPTDDDLTGALEELLSDGEALTRSLLGSGPRATPDTEDEDWDGDVADDEWDDD